MEKQLHERSGINNLTRATYHAYLAKADDDRLIHDHEQVELIFVVAGKCSITVENQLVTAEAGNTILLRPGVRHAIQFLNVDQHKVLILNIDDHFLNNRLLAVKEFQPLGELLRKSPGAMLFDNTAEINEMASSLLDTKGMRGVITIIRMLNVLSRSSRKALLPPDLLSNDGHLHYHDEKIAKVIAYTEEHYKEQISLATVAELLSFTETSFCRYFKLQTGKTYFQYLVEVRIAQACKLLLEKSCDIEEVCFSCGFNNPSNFYKQFKRIVKQTPREFQMRGKLSSNQRPKLVA